jgi:hypothetical protein
VYTEALCSVAHKLRCHVFDLNTCNTLIDTSGFLVDVNYLAGKHLHVQLKRDANAMFSTSVNALVKPAKGV